MIRCLCVAVLGCFTLFSAAASAELISWDDLIDQEAQDYEDPYLALEYDQLFDVRTVAMERQRLESSDLTEAARVASEAELMEAESRLTEAGIDADWLISQRWIVADRREKAAVAVNPEIDGKTVSLGGFAIPAPPDPDGSTVVYLVPERGMCSHMPPPNPNQMIRARLSDKWFPSMMHEPVRLTGILRAQETQHVFRVVDGDVPMRASLLMEVSEIETAGNLQSDFPTAEEWAEGLADRLRALHQSPAPAD